MQKIFKPKFLRLTLAGLTTKLPLKKPEDLPLK